MRYPRDCKATPPLLNRSHSHLEVYPDTVQTLHTPGGIQLVTCASPLLWHRRETKPTAGYSTRPMITLEERIAKTRRLLRHLEKDQLHLHLRLSPLGAEHRQSATALPAVLAAG